MISRRLIRIKILQVLYAENSNDAQSVTQSEKELFFSINKAYDLYHLLMLIPLELIKLDEQRIDLSKQKLRPTNEDLNPNMRFCNNRFLAQLKSNWQLAKYIADKKVNWVNNQEIFKNLYNKVRESDYFKAYMQKVQSTYDDDKDIIISILEKEIPTFIDLEILLEEMSIFWNDDVEFMLSMVVKTFKPYKESDMPEKRLMPLFKNEDDEDFAKKLFRKVFLNKNEYGEMIKKHSQNWEFDRIAIMDILIMQMAIAEIMEFPSIPIKVSLNEYIDIAKFYSTSNSNTFINGILDNVVKELRTNNKIVKTGRGLIEN
jgi:transcription antitermination protein NusB